MKGIFWKIRSEVNLWPIGEIEFFEKNSSHFGKHLAVKVSLSKRKDGATCFQSGGWSHTQKNGTLHVPATGGRAWLSSLIRRRRRWLFWPAHAVTLCVSSLMMKIIHPVPKMKINDPSGFCQPAAISFLPLAAPSSGREPLSACKLKCIANDVVK